jgi:hypothetical protein
MTRIKWLGLYLVAATTLVVVASPSALAATNNPGWTVCEEGMGSGTKYEDSACTKESILGKFEAHELLLESEKRLFLAEVAKGFLAKLDLHGNHVLCKKAKFNKEALASGGSIAKAEGLMEYEECEVEGKPSCKINGTNKAKSALVTAEIVYATKTAAEAEEAVHSELFVKAKSGSVLFSGEMTGEGCAKPGSYEVTGDLLYLMGEATKHIQEHLFEPAPESHYFTNESGKTVEHSVTPSKDLSEENPIAILWGIRLAVWGVGAAVTWYAATR